MVQKMTHRERIMGTICGQPVDHIAWAPRWELWYNAAVRDGRLPEQYRQMSFYDMTRALGMGIKGRGISAYKRSYDDVRIVEIKDGQFLRTEYHMPEGMLYAVLENTPELENAGVRGRQIKNLIEGEEDFALAIRLIERTRILPNDDAVRDLTKSIGNDGVVLVDGGFSPLHRAMRDFIGYEDTYYMLVDYPQQMERLIKALAVEAEAELQMAARCPARLIEIDGNYDIALTPPPLYKRYFLPWFQHVAEELHAVDKIFVSHTDGHNDGLMELLKESGFDVAEAFTSPPMTNIGVAEARRIWGKQITIWGGIASTLFSPPYSRAEFEAHVRDVIAQAAPGDHFILGTGDNVTTDGELDRVIWVSKLINGEL